jgi:nucleotide-binding universal stress UspA family protein
MPEGLTGFRKILLAVDLSAPLPETQLAFLKDFAEKQQAEMGLLHVRVDDEIPAPDEARTATELTRVLGARLEERTLGKGEDVASAILSHWHERNYDLLVTTPHRHTWIDALLMGSETRRIAGMEDIAMLALPEK